MKPQDMNLKNGTLRIIPLLFFGIKRKRVGRKVYKEFLVTILVKNFR